MTLFASGQTTAWSKTIPDGQHGTRGLMQDLQPLSCPLLSCPALPSTGESWYRWLFRFDMWVHKEEDARFHYWEFMYRNFLRVSLSPFTRYGNEETRKTPTPTATRSNMTWDNKTWRFQLTLPCDMLA
jgi:hypothetical protein